jgi:dihydroorotase
MLALLFKLTERGSASSPKVGCRSVGGDADITVFDPDRVIDRATFDNPAQYSEGIPYVLVRGVLVVRDGKLAQGVAPGRGVRR